MRMIRMMFLCGLLFMLALPALALEKPPAPGEKMPPPNVAIDEFLTTFVGEWAGKGMVLDPQTNKEETMKDMEKWEPSLGGKFLSIYVKSEPDRMGRVYEARGFLNYDLDRKQYQLRWFDSLGFFSDFLGKREGDSLVFAFPMKEKPGTIIYRKSGASRLEFMMQIGEGKEARKLMDLTYEKKATAEEPRMKEERKKEEEKRYYY